METKASKPAAVPESAPKAHVPPASGGPAGATPEPVFPEVGALVLAPARNGLFGIFRVVYAGTRSVWKQAPAPVYFVATSPWIGRREEFDPADPLVAQVRLSGDDDHQHWTWIPRSPLPPDYQIVGSILPSEEERNLDLDAHARPVVHGFISWSSAIDNIRRLAYQDYQERRAKMAPPSTAEALHAAWVEYVKQVAAGAGSGGGEDEPDLPEEKKLLVEDWRDWEIDVAKEIAKLTKRKPAAETDGERTSVRYRDRTVSYLNPNDGANRWYFVAACRLAMLEDFDIRAFAWSLQSDTFCYLVKSHEWWNDLEAAAGAEATAKVFVPADQVGISTELLKLTVAGEAGAETLKKAPTTKKSKSPGMTAPKAGKTPKK